MSNSAIRRIDWLQVSIMLGVVLLLFGLQLRSVEGFVCTPRTTQLLADWFGPDQQTAQGALQRILVEKTEHRHVLHPPAWLGWAALSAGFVLFIHGAWGKWRK